MAKVPKPPRILSTPPPRLSVLLARESDVAVVFRRGPSKRVLIIRWQRGDDSFYLGQWFNGRIYENRCDLSPTGEHLLYFAASYRKPHYSWTAVSRPPFLTALVLWPKGDCWGGGGQFASRRKILLNHRPAETALADDFRLPKAYTVEPFGSHPGRGEDSPIHDATLERDGWRLVQQGRESQGAARGGGKVAAFDPPEVLAKAHPFDKHVQLLSRLLGILRVGGPWWIRESAVARDGNTTELGETDWADWDANGDLLFAQSGRVFRSRWTKPGFADPCCLFDGTGMLFQPVPPPDEALTWDKPLKLAALPRLSTDP